MKDDRRLVEWSRASGGSRASLSRTPHGGARGAKPGQKEGPMQSAGTLERNPFDHRAPEWWPPRGDLVVLHGLNPVRFAYFDPLVPGWRGVEVLDVGCGGGYTCEFLAARGAVVSGTDISERSLDEARRHGEQNGLAINYVACTPTHLPFDSCGVDVVTCFDALEHVDDLRSTLTEIHRVLRPGGTLLFDTVNQTFWARLALLWLGEGILRKFPRGTHEWQRFVRPDALRRRLEGAGFADLEFAGLRFKRPGVKGGLPFTVTLRGFKGILYFGSARKASEPCRR